MQANAQLVTKTICAGEETYVFFVPDGMHGEFRLGDGTRVVGADRNIYKCTEGMEAEQFVVENGTARCRVLVISRSLANDMFVLHDGRLVFTDEAILEDGEGIRLESTKNTALIRVYPADGLTGLEKLQRMESAGGEIFGTYQVQISEKKAKAVVKQVGPSRYTIQIPEDALDGVNVNVESGMAARSEEVKSYIAELKSVRMQPIYEIEIA